MFKDLDTELELEASIKKKNQKKFEEELKQKEQEEEAKRGEVFSDTKEKPTYRLYKDDPIDHKSDGRNETAVEGKKYTLESSKISSSTNIPENKTNTLQDLSEISFNSNISVDFEDVGRFVSTSSFAKGAFVAAAGNIKFKEGKDRYSASEVANIALKLGADKEMACMLAVISRNESQGKVDVERYEAHINDSSVGMMQVLTRTAESLYNSGYKKYNPSDLKDAEAAVYFAMAHLERSEKYYEKNQETIQEKFPRMTKDEFMIRAYNGGNGWWDNGNKAEQMTANYMNKYMKNSSVIAEAIEVKDGVELIANIPPHLPGAKGKGMNPS